MVLERVWGGGYMWCGGGVRVVVAATGLNGEEEGTWVQLTLAVEIKCSASYNIPSIWHFWIFFILIHTTNTRSHTCAHARARTHIYVCRFFICMGNWRVIVALMYASIIHRCMYSYLDVHNLALVIMRCNFPKSRRKIRNTTYTPISKQ